MLADAFNRRDRHTIEASLHEHCRRTDGMNHFLDAAAAPRFHEDLLATRNNDVMLRRMATRDPYGTQLTVQKGLPKRVVVRSKDENLGRHRSHDLVHQKQSSQ